MKNWSLKKLTRIAAEICGYALNHYNTGERHRPETPWPDDSPNHSLAWSALGASSYTLACIAAQHTPGGRNGVESEAPFYALRMWEFMSLKKRRRLAKTFFEELGAQKQYTKAPHQARVVNCTPVSPHADGLRCRTCDIYLDGNEPDEVAVGGQCLHCSSAAAPPPHAPPAVTRPCGGEYIATDPQGLLGSIKILESACPQCLRPMEFEIGVSIRMDTNPKVVSIDTDGTRGVDYWWCAHCGIHTDPLQLDALAEARADAMAAESRNLTPGHDNNCKDDMSPEGLQREVEEIAKTYALWTQAAAAYELKEAPSLHASMTRAMSRRMGLAFCDCRTRPRVGDRVITLKGDNDSDERDAPRQAPPGTCGRVEAVDVESQGYRCDVIFDTGVWVVLELYEICDPEQYAWEP